MSKPIKLGYWKCRGIGMPIQMLAFYLDIELEIERYEPFETDSGDGWDRSQWLDKKFQLGLDFPNLPYLIDGNFKLTESFAIMKYLVRKFDEDSFLIPRGIQNLAYAEMLEGWINDLRWRFIYTAYGDGSPEQIKSHFEHVHKKMKELQKFLAPSRKYLVGNLSYIDFYIWEVIDVHLNWKPSLLNTLFPSIRNWYENFRRIPKIRQFLESEHFFEYPVTSKMAIWGGKNQNDGVLDRNNEIRS